MPTIIHPPSIPFRWMVQRPQQMFMQFSALGYTCIFCNPARWDSPPRVRRQSENLIVATKMDPLSIKHPEPRILWLDDPSMVRNVDKYHPHLVVYDALDQPAEEFAGWAPYLSDLRKKADVIFATSRKLYEENKKEHPNVHLCPNGVDFNHFSNARYGHLPVPPDIRDRGRPLVGYVGAVASWLDWELIDYITGANPQLSFIFVGPLCNIAPPFTKPNLHFLGYRDYRVLPSYVQCFDVCLIPFRLTSMTEGCNPIKMYEYLSAGKPVVSTPLPEVAGMGGVLVGRSPEEFNLLMHHALHRDTEESRNCRVEEAYRNSWRQRAAMAMSVMDRGITEKGLM